MKEKTKVKVWVDINEVLAPSEIPKQVEWLVEVMEEIPKGEKSN